MTAIRVSILVDRAGENLIGRRAAGFERFRRGAWNDGFNEFVERRSINYDPAMQPPGQRAWFLKLACIFEGGLVVLGVFLGWLLRVDLIDSLRPDPKALLAGVLGAVPPFLLLLLTDRFKIPALVRIKRLVLEALGPPLAACRWYELILVAALAGVGEELLFRGVIQPLCERWLPMPEPWNRVGALILPNVVFGLLHLITPTYALLAGAMGVYFGVMLDMTGTRNLWAPILAHGLYDYWAFLLVVWTIRHSQSQPPSPQIPSLPDADGPTQSAPPS